MCHKTLARTLSRERGVSRMTFWQCNGAYDDDPTGRHDRRYSCDSHSYEWKFCGTAQTRLSWSLFRHFHRIDYSNFRFMFQQGQGSLRTSIVSVVSTTCLCPLYIIPNPIYQPHLNFKFLIISTFFLFCILY
jgi:hypothetical protein